MTARRPRSLVQRLVTLATVWAVTVLAVSALALVVFYRQADSARADSDLSHDIDQLVAGVEINRGELTPPAKPDPQSISAFGDMFWQIIWWDISGAKWIQRSRSLWDSGLPLSPQDLNRLNAADGQPIYMDVKGPRDRPLRMTVQVVKLPGLKQAAVFMVARDRTDAIAARQSFETAIAVLVLLLGAGLVAAVVVQVRIGLQPLFDLSREVARLRTGDADRIEGRYPGELEPLANELNALMAHNQEVLERQRTHVGNLAHALKTPLSVLLAESESQQGPLAEVVQRQARLMGQHVDHHLRRARAAARAQGQGEKTQVAPVLDDLARTLERIFGGRVTRLDWDCDDDLYFLGERQDLMEIAGNIMENACKWSAGRVNVQAEAAAPRTLTLTVEDDGPGLAAEQRGEVLKRGARLDEQTPGSGLGLSIVDDLARAYGGSVALDASPLGGLRVRVTLPAAQSPDTASS